MLYILHRFHSIELADCVQQTVRDNGAVRDYFMVLT